MNNRLSEYFAEIEEIAKANPNEATRLKQEHLQIFQKSGIFYKTIKPDNSDIATSFDSCNFSNTFNTNGIFILDGKTYDFNGNPIDLDEDDDEANWWKK